MQCSRWTVNSSNYMIRDHVSQNHLPVCLITLHLITMINVLAQSLGAGKYNVWYAGDVAKAP